MECSFNVCKKPVKARGLCSGHWAQWRRGASLAPLIIFEKKPCAVAGCGKLANARGFCYSHYNNLKRRGNALSEPPVKWHRMGNTPEYGVWVSMKTRCYNSNETTWKYYGGRGIKVCDRWQGTEGFVNFLTDMGKRPPGKQYIDRIDPNGDYEPSNCRWVNSATHARNKRTPWHNTSGFRGVYKIHKGSPRWYAKIGNLGKVIHLGGFDSIDEAVAARKEAEVKYGYEPRPVE